MKILIKYVCPVSVRWTLSCWWNSPEELLRHDFITYTEIPHLLVLAVKGGISLKLPAYQMDCSSSSSISAVFFWKTALTTGSINSYEAFEHILYFYCSINAVSVKGTYVLMNSLQDIAEKLRLPNAWRNFYIRCLGLFFQRGALALANVSEDLGSRLMVCSAVCEILDGGRNITSEVSSLTWQKAAWCTGTAYTVTRAGVLTHLFSSAGLLVGVWGGRPVVLSIASLWGMVKGNGQVQVFIFPEHDYSAFCKARIMSQSLFFECCVRNLEVYSRYRISKGLLQLFQLWRW